MKSIFAGVHRPGWDALLNRLRPSGDNAVCSCGQPMHNREALREHWQRGHWDEPQYQEAQKKELAREDDGWEHWPVARCIRCAGIFGLGVCMKLYRPPARGLVGCSCGGSFDLVHVQCDLA